MYFVAVGLQGDCWGFQINVYLAFTNGINVHLNWHSSFPVFFFLLWCMLYGEIWLSTPFPCPKFLSQNSLGKLYIRLLIWAGVISWLVNSLVIAIVITRKNCWHDLMVVCKAHYKDYAELLSFLSFALHIFSSARVCLVNLFIWQHLYSCGSDERSIRWLVRTHMDLECSLFYLSLLWLGSLLTPITLTALCVWWQGLFVPIFHTKLLRGLHPHRLAQHDSMLCLHPWMLDHPSFGGWLTPWLMMIFYSHLFFGFALCLHWTFPGLLLSLPLASKFAPTLVVSHTCVCWLLACGQQGREEVRGKNPTVYDEIISETNMFIHFNEYWIELVFWWWSNLVIHQRQCLPQIKRQMNFAPPFDAARQKHNKTGQIWRPFASASALWRLIVSVFINVYSDSHGTPICIIDLSITLNVFVDFLFGRAGFGLPTLSMFP